jgi:molybdate transport system permease protein
VSTEAPRRVRGALFAIALFASLTAALALLCLPVLAIFLETSPGELIDSLGEQRSQDALLLSLETTLAAIAIIVIAGTPAAYLLATREFRGKSLVTTAIELPLVLPPAVAGIALLAAFGPEGILGPLLGDAGIELVLQTSGVVLALTFVAAPFYMRQAQAAFAAVDRSLLDAARTLGASEASAFARVAVPASGQGIAAGIALAWGRALGEFGATLIFAGSFQGITQTAPLAIFASFSRDFPAALALSAVLVIAAAALLLSVKLLGRTPLLGGSAG